MEGIRVNKTDSENGNNSLPFLNIVDNEIVIPGLQKTYTFIQISDTHIMTVDEDSTEDEIQKMKN